MALTPDARRLQIGNDCRAVRFALLCERCRVFHGGRGGVETDDHASSSLKLISTARAEWVMAPTEMKSALGFGVGLDGF